MSERTTVNSGFPILSVLGIIFIVLKLSGIGAVATWSWWWVLAPFWIGIVFAILFLVFTVLVLAWAGK